MITVLVLCLVTLAFVIVNTVLVATLHRLNLKLASKQTEKQNGEPVPAPENTADENTNQND
ncbi:MAG: hypothetical protein K2O41_01230 [Clostridia bacterium]|nr:hypothetical protein [Clostridia bacterium]